MLLSSADGPSHAPTRAALVAYLTSWADDELILGHRDSEWTGVAPQIEEDVAFSSIAQDEIGHAAMLYRIVAALTGDDPDRLALRRPAAAYRHAELVEMPKGDWAGTIARHYLYDLADSCRLEAARESSYAPLAHAARTMAREEHYHLMHDIAWWERLRDGTPESALRLAAAVRALLPLAVDVLCATPGDDLLVAAGILPRPAAATLGEWRWRVEEALAGDATPGPAWLASQRVDLVDLLEPAPHSKRERPVSAHFAALHGEMTSVSASGLGDKW